MPDSGHEGKTDALPSVGIHKQIGGHDALSQAAR